jgi:hypothetical protein
VSFLILLPVFAVNDITGFTYYYFNGRKIEQVARITEVLGDTSMTPSVKQWLHHKREEILSRKSVTSGLFSLLSKTAARNIDTVSTALKTNSNDFFIQDTNSSINTSANNNKLNNTNPNATPINAQYINPESDSCASVPDVINITENTVSQNQNSFIARNNWLFFFCSSWLFLVVIVFGTPVIVFSKDVVDGGIGLKIFVLFIVWILGLLASLLYYWLFGLIFTTPVFGHWWVTYLIIAIINPLSVSVMGFLFSGAFKKQT